MLVGVLAATPLAAQRTVKVSDGWVEMRDNGTAMAGATIENGTMYEIYVTAAESEVAGEVALAQAAGGQVTPVKELMVAAFDRLELTAQGPHVTLRQLKRPLKAGEKVTIQLHTDAGERLPIEATVR